MSAATNELIPPPPPAPRVESADPKPANPVSSSGSKKRDRPDENSADSANVEEEEDENENSVDYSKYAIPMLKMFCKQQGLRVGGKRADLLARLKNPEAERTASRAKRRRSSTAGTKRLSTQAVHKRLAELGVDRPEHVSRCLKRGIQRGFISLDDPEGGSSALDKVVVNDSCDNCGESMAVTVRDLLEQSDYGDDYEDGSDGASAVCPSEDCGSKWYFTRLCEGKPDRSDGKFHNHCSRCPGFGQCIGDYRMTHCGRCNKHYFAGLSGFACDNCERRRGGGGGYGGRRGGRGDDCAVM
eukprot:625813_1